MRTGKDEIRQNIETAKLELSIDRKIVDQLKAMESFTKIPQTELVTTALKRFIASHKDYFPEDYKA